jgi:hypothetical protein
MSRGVSLYENQPGFALAGWPWIAKSGLKRLEQVRAAPANPEAAKAPPPQPWTPAGSWLI